MARRTFDVVDVTEILVHWHAGRSISEIAQSLGVDRKTIRKYVAPAIQAGMTPGGASLGEAEWDARVREWFPELADTRLRQVTWPAIGKHHEYICEQLKAGVTVTTVHQRLRDERGLAVSVASFRRYVAANVPEETRRSQVKVLRPWPAEPGAEAQIDYGRLGRWLDPVTGKLVTVWAFVMVLACSRHLFVRPVIRLDQHAWSECHVKAFGFFGGVPARLVLEYVPRNIFQDDVDGSAVGAGRPDGLERGQGMVAALAQPGNAPQLVIGQGVAAVKVADPVGAVVGSRQAGGLLCLAQQVPWQGRIDNGPNWSNAKHRSGNLLVTSSIRSSLASLSGSAGSFQVRAGWKEICRACRICRSRSRPMVTTLAGLRAR